MTFLTGMLYRNGTGLYFEHHASDGPVVVMAHGLASDLGFWPRKALSLLSDFSLILYDLRGHGRSDMASSGYTTADMATDLEGLLDHFDVKQAHLVGHSFGGSVALHYGILHPRRTASLTLADTRIRLFQPVQRLQDLPGSEFLETKLELLGFAIDPDDPEVGLRLLEAMARAVVEGKARSGTGPLLFRLLFGGSKERAARWLSLLDTTTARQDLVAPAGLTVEKIQAVRHPVLACFGERSHCLPSCRGLERNLSDCKVVLIPGAGHFHPIARPRLFAGVLRRFVTQVTEPSGDRPAL